MALPGELVNSSRDRFTLYLRSVPNHRIDDESLKEYFYRGQDDNNKAVLDTIAGGSYGECPYAEIAEKLEKISQKSLEYYEVRYWKKYLNRAINSQSIRR